VAKEKVESRCDLKLYEGEGHCGFIKIIRNFKAYKKDRFPRRTVFC